MRVGASIGEPAGSPDGEFDLAGMPPLIRELAVTAAVRERFGPVELLQEWIDRHGPQVPDELVNTALDVSLSLAAASHELSGTAEAYQLPLDLRREVLSAAGLDGVRAALLRETPRTQTEQAFAALVTGYPPDPGSMARGELLALASGAAWAQGLAGAQQIAATQVERRIRDQTFVERVGGADLSQFVGRKTLLKALRALWRLSDRPTVLIEGPGGIGKSIAVARFFQLLLAEEEEGLPRPDAILHLDFDLPDLQAAARRSLEAEIVRQLALRWSPDGNAELLSLLRSVGSASAHNRMDSNRGLTQESFRDYRSNFSPLALLRHGLQLFREDHPGPLHLILFADSFERAQSLDEAAEASVQHIAQTLRESGADLMLIYAARSYRTPTLLDPGRRLSIQRVPRFRQAEAIDYLLGQAGRKGIALRRQDADRANRTLKGWPLGLRMAASMIGGSAEDFSVKDWLAALERGGRSVRATLYERLLERLRDEDLRKLARPGLLVRRITAELIDQVLAGPCGLGSMGSGDRLMYIAEDEGQLFQRNPADPGALWHRQDLREIMLPALRKDIAPAVVRAIHDNAVDYYAAREGDIARAEELYHRLARGDGRDEVAARWTETAGLRLLGALDELPARSATLLRLLIGGGRRDATHADTGSSLRLDALRTVARNRLLDGDTALGDIFAEAGVAESVLSPLGDIQAQVLLRQGRHAELLDAAAALSAAREDQADNDQAGYDDAWYDDAADDEALRDVPRPVQARIQMAAAGLAEGLGDTARAIELWREALRLEGSLEPIERLAVRIALARVLRLTSPSTHADAPGRDEHIRAACRLLVDIAGEVRASRVTALEAVAELSEVLQWPAQRLETVESGTASLLKSLFRRLAPLFPSALDDRARLEQLAAMLGEEPERVRKPAELDRSAHGLYDSAGHDLALAALRSEVDAAYAAVAGRDPFGGPLPQGPRSFAYA